MESCYWVQPILHLGDHTILSCCRVQETKKGRAGFALAFHPIVEKIEEEVPGLLINAWYLDDGTLCISAEDLCAVLAIMKSRLLP